MMSKDFNSLLTKCCHTVQGECVYADTKQGILQEEFPIGASLSGSPQCLVKP